MKVLTVGGATQDIILLVDELEYMSLTQCEYTVSYLLLEEGKKQKIQKIVETTGGGATNSAVSFSLLGHQVSVATCVGADQAGERVMNELSHYGIRIKFVATVADGRTGVSYIIPCPSGDRVVLTCRGVNESLSSRDLEPILYHEFDLVYITSLSGPASSLLPLLVKQISGEGVPVVINPGTSQLVAGAAALAQALPYVQVLILNLEESCMLKRSLDASGGSDARHVHEPVDPKPSNSDGTRTEHSLQDVQGKESLMGDYASCTSDDCSMPLLLRQNITYQSFCFNIREYFKQVLAAGPSVVVLTNGADGVYLAHQTARGMIEILYHESISQNVVCTLGAGDAFGSCFTALWAEGAALEEALVGGIINSASVVGKYGAKAGLLKRVELQNRIRLRGLSGVQCFKIP